MNYDLDTKEGMANAIAWQTQLCKYLKEGGMWCVPRSNEIYFVHPKDKFVVAPTGGEKAVNAVFREMGYEIKEAFTNEGKM